MPERQRPRETARACLNPLTYELIEQRETFEKLTRFPSNDCIDLCRRHSQGCQQGEINLNARWSRGSTDTICSWPIPALAPRD